MSDTPARLFRAAPDNTHPITEHQMPLISPPTGPGTGSTKTPDKRCGGVRSSMHHGAAPKAPLLCKHTHKAKYAQQYKYTHKPRLKWGRASNQPIHTCTAPAGFIHSPRNAEASACLYKHTCVCTTIQVGRVLATTL